MTVVGFADAVLGFVARYGYAAVFVYMALETAFILHFVPSELVVPFAASRLVHDPVSFVLFVADATAGATAGSLLAYVVFGRYGERVLDGYGHVIHVSEGDVDRSQALFRRYGESTVFWCRMLPLLRSLVSIPAGLAAMPLRRFLVYSAAGAALFNTGLTYLVYTGSGTTSPLGVVLAAAARWLAPTVAYVRAHVLLVAVVACLALAVAAVAWHSRDWIRAHPALATQVVLHAVRLLGVLVGAAFVAGALSSPSRAFAIVVAAWDDPLALVRLGFSERLALALVGVLVAFAGALVYELGTLVELARLREAVEERWP